MASKRDVKRRRVRLAKELRRAETEREQVRD